MRRAERRRQRAGSVCGGCPPLLTVSRRALMPPRARYRTEPAAAVGPPFAACATIAYATAPRPAAAGGRHRADADRQRQADGRERVLDGRPQAVRSGGLPQSRRCTVAARPGSPTNRAPRWRSRCPVRWRPPPRPRSEPARPMQSNSRVAGGDCGAETSLQPAGRSESCRLIRARSGRGGRGGRRRRGGRREPAEGDRARGRQ